jgi:hypothetical protein
LLELLILREGSGMLEECSMKHRKVSIGAREQQTRCCVWMLRLSCEKFPPAVSCEWVRNVARDASSAMMDDTDMQ